MTVEFNALLKTSRLSLFPSHPSQDLVGCKWFCLIKHNADGFIERFKVHMVAKFLHQHGFDYDETLVPLLSLLLFTLF